MDDGIGLVSSFASTTGTTIGGVAPVVVPTPPSPSLTAVGVVTAIGTASSVDPLEPAVDHRCAPHGRRSRHGGAQPSSATCSSGRFLLIAVVLGFAWALLVTLG